ncbi:MAG: IucA/IucC family C-terminal-domain containing protein, partial [Bdellovibrionota bacterium]
MRKPILNKILSLVVGAVVGLSALTGHAETELAENFDKSRFMTVNEIPTQIAEWIYFEQLVNLRFTGTIFAPLDHSGLDPRFDPFNRPVIQMGYLEIPVEKASFRIDKSLLPESARRVLFFKRGGVEYIRHFVHPLMENKYADEAKLYGETYVDSKGKTKSRLKYGEFGATLSSSMRSWVIWSLKNPTDFIGEKTSIAVVVGMDRKNDVDKLERANAITQVTKEIPAKDKKTYGFDMLVEPVTQNTATTKGGKHYGNITRVFPTMAHANGKPRFIPGFSLTSPDPKGGLPLLVQMIEASGLPAEEYIAKNIIEPLVRSYAYLTFQHGIVGEPHQQNVLFELNEKGQLTGRVLYRDLDAFKPDIELRHLRNLSDEPFLGAKRPFKLLKMGKAEHDYRRSYMSYVKGAWAESMENMIAQFKNQVPALASATELPELFDKTLLTELVRH